VDVALLAVSLYENQDPGTGGDEPAGKFTTDPMVASPSLGDDGRLSIRPIVVDGC
jgi:hypothetical protein